MNQQQLLNALAEICGSEHVYDAPLIDKSMLSDWTNTVQAEARAAVFPATTEQVSKILALCNAGKIALVVQGGNTGMSGGAVPLAAGEGGGGAVLMAMRRMNAIRTLDTAARTMTVEAGCILEEVCQYAARHDLFFPLSLGAKGSCQIGGNLATNAGGLNVLRYGNMRSLCLGIEAVFADGRILSALSGLHKDNSGYDLRNLIIGSEGTLAVITAATLKLFSPPQTALTAWAVPPSPQAALELMNFIQQRTNNALVAFEIMPAVMLSLIARYKPALTLPYTTPPPWLVLLEAADVETELMQDILMQAMEAQLLQDTVIAASESQRAAFWRVREEAPLIMASHGGWRRADVSVPLAQLPAFIADIEKRLLAVCEGLYIIGFGHLGDGNLHLAARPLDEEPQNNPELAHQLQTTLYDCVADYGGSFSAEHGIGQLKTEVMLNYKEATALSAMRTIKQALDKNNILNPGKVFPRAPSSSSADGVMGS